MTITFNFIPNNLKTPGPISEINNDAAQRAPTGQPHTALAIGQKLAAGIAANDTPISITSASQADEQFGQGSLLARICTNYLANNVTVALVAISVSDDGSAAQAAGTLTFVGTATVAGSVTLLVGGTTVTTAVAVADTATVVAAAVAASINAKPELSVTAAGSVDDCEFTAKNGGEVANGFLIFVSFNGESLPAGITTTTTTVTLAAGATDPDNSTIIAALGDTQYNTIIQPYLNATALGLWKTELNARFKPEQAIEGIQIAYKNDTFSNLQTFGTTQNDQFLCVAGANLLPDPAEEIAAAIAGQVAAAANVDPAKPFQTLRLAGITPCKSEFIFTQLERNLLLNGGIATVRPTTTGDVTIGRLVTTYQTNAAGFDDESFLDANTFYILSFLRFSFLQQMSKFARFKLGANGATGQDVMTPRTMRTEMISLFTFWESLGLVQDRKAFDDGLQVEINAQDRNRLDIVLPPTLIAQLRVIASRIDFVL